jgi:putative DNA primase/helicase
MLYRNPAIDELAQIPQWVCWKPEKRGPGKPTKVPYCVGGRFKAASDKPDTWDTFEACYDSAFVQGHAAGIGFVVTKQSGIIGVDCDNCIDQDGNIDGPVLRWIRRFNSYAEISPSGKGIRIFCRGAMPIDGLNPVDSQWEIYCAKRYLTVTGKHIEESPLAINEAQEAVDALLSILTAGKIKSDGEAPTTKIR